MSACVKDDRIRLDLHEHRRIYQRADLYQRRRRSHVCENEATFFGV